MELRRGKVLRVLGQIGGVQVHVFRVLIPLVCIVVIWASAKGQVEGLATLTSGTRS